MAQVSITQLPQALALTGLEPVPIVQNGVTVQTTTGSIAGAGALNYPFLTVGSTAGLTQARYIATNAGLSLTDNGAGNTLQMNLIGAALSLNSSGNGIQVKTGLNTVTNVSLAAGTGLSATNADGTTGNPTISLGAALQQFVSLTGTGMLAIQNGLTAKVNILGTTSQTSILNGNGAGDVTVGIANNPILPGTGSATLPNGTTAQRSGSSGAVRYNTSLQQFEGYTNTGWNQFSLTGAVTSFSAGTTGFSPNTDTTGAVTLSGTLNVANGGTGGTATPTAGTVAYGNGTAYAFTAVGTSGQVLTSAGAGTPTWTTPTTGTVTAVSVATANGLAGTSSGGATPVLTLSTTITGVLKGNGTAISAATSGTDYAPATSGTSILYGNGSGGFSNVTIGTGVAFAGGTLSATGSGGTVTSVTGTAPVVSSGGNTPAISMAAATTSVNGYLTSTDWTTFNSKQAALVSGTNIKTVNGTTLLGSGDLGTITYAYGGTGQTTVTTGDLLYGSASNVWSKLGIGTTGQILRVVSGAPAWGTDYTGTVTSVAALTLGTTGTDLSSTVTNSTTTPVITLNVPTASATNRGALSAADWTTFNNKGSGSVTSVSFTGGLISVATATTTPALTVAGTSGGIPYFSSASTWATSAALAANAIVIGGGAGTAPSTTTTGTGVLTALGTNVGTAGAFVVNGGALGTPSSGTVTNLTGTASININGTVGATTANTGAFSTLTTTGTINSITVGMGAGNLLTNVAVGLQSLQANTTGSENTAIGLNSLYSNTIGTENTAIGSSALLFNISGNYNTAIGEATLQANTTGNQNTATGSFALNHNTTGTNNVANGQSALNANTTGSQNTALGISALFSATASSNTALGFSSGSSITTGEKNVIIGSYTGSAAPISATGSNYVVLSDGDGNVRQYINSSGNTVFNGTITATGISGGTF